MTSMLQKVWEVIYLRENDQEDNQKEHLILLMNELFMVMGKFLKLIAYDYNYSIENMRISFHYCLPSADPNSPNHADTFSTPAKAKTLYGSRQTAVSAKEEATMHAYRIHKLTPSVNPIGYRKTINKQAQRISSSSANESKIVFTYMVDFSRNNIQSEIEELKILLRELIKQENDLHEQRQMNRKNYHELLEKIKQGCSAMGDKARELKSAIVQLRIDLTEPSQ